jgi:hypothetical protein
MPEPSRRKFATQLDHLVRFTRQHRMALTFGVAAAVIFALAALRPALGTPLALGLTVIALRRRA